GTPGRRPRPVPSPHIRTAGRPSDGVPRIRAGGGGGRRCPGGDGRRGGRHGGRLDRALPATGRLSRGWRDPPVGGPGGGTAGGPGPASTGGGRMTGVSAVFRLAILE